MCPHTHTPTYRHKDTENDASKAGRYGHAGVALSGNGDVRKAVWEENKELSVDMSSDI